MTIPKVVCPLCKLQADEHGRCPDCKQDLTPLAYLDAQATVHYNRALDLAAEGDDDGATRAAEAAVGQDRGFADAWVVLGKLYRKAGRPADARRAWESAVAAAPEHRGARDALDALSEEKPDRPRRRGLLALVLGLLLLVLIGLVLWLLLRPAPAASAPPASGLLTVSQRDGTIALTGAVPDEATLPQLRDAAVGAAGNHPVDASALVVQPGSGQPPLDAATAGTVVRALAAEAGADATVVVTPERAAVSGTFPDGGARQRVDDGLRNALPGREVRDQAQIGSGGPTSGQGDGAQLDAAIQSVQQAAPIRFGPSDATPSPAGLAAVNAIAVIVRGHQVAIEVDGFTAPAPGPADAAQQLSLARARTVHDALVANGVPDSSIRVRGLADSQPLPDPDASRRVAVRVLPAG